MARKTSAAQAAKPEDKPKLTAIRDAYTKTQVVQALAEQTGLHRQQIQAVFTALTDLMEFGRERIATYNDARDLIACRKTPARKAVDANHRARTGNLFQHAPQLFFVVRELIDFCLAECLREAAGFRLRFGGGRQLAPSASRRSSASQRVTSGGISPSPAEPV